MQKSNMSVKPFVKWAGGKRQLLSSIENLLPTNFSKLPDMTYIEPFVGGGAVLFYMLEKYKNIKKAVINDINQNLIITYKIVRDNPMELIEKLSFIQKEYLAMDESERKKFYIQNRLRFNTHELSDLDNSATLIFLNKTCFNGLYRVNSKGEFNVPFGRYSNPLICDKETIINDSALLKNVVITANDYTFTENFATENTFFYFDPPYRPITKTSNFNSYSKGIFNDDEQIRLSKFCLELNDKGYHFMQSNSDCFNNNNGDTFFDDLYSKFFIERVFATRSINANSEKRGKLPELIIRNYSKEMNQHKPIRLTKNSSWLNSQIDIITK